MVIEKVSNLDLCREIAELKGWSHITVTNKFFGVEMGVPPEQEDKAGNYFSIPRYDTDPAEAMVLLAELPGLGWYVNYITQGADGVWGVRVAYHGGGVVHGRGSWLERAIAEAYLAARKGV